MSQLFGKYPATVLAATDPQGAGRIQVDCPALRGRLGRARPVWARACLAPGSTAGQGGPPVLPAAGSSVWVEFEAGDRSLPLWTGVPWPAPGAEPVPVAPSPPEEATLATALASIRLAPDGTVVVQSPTRVDVSAPVVALHASVVQVDGLLQCRTLIASTGVISPSYTPGAGNVW